MEPDHCTSSTSTDGSTDGADGPISIKEEPDDADGPQTNVFSDEQLSSQQHLADHKYCESIDCKNDINITHDDCVSKAEEDNLTVKSEPDDNHNSTETSNRTSVKCEVVPSVVPKLYGVKNEFPCTTQTESEIVYNNIGIDCELVEVPGKLDCEHDIIGNVNNVGSLGDVNQESRTSNAIDEIDVKETNTLGE